VEAAVASTDKRRSRGLSEMEVEGLKDLLGETEDDASIIDEEEEEEGELEDDDVPVRRI
jgi:hypothetical protein